MHSLIMMLELIAKIAGFMALVMKAVVALAQH